MKNLFNIEENKLLYFITLYGSAIILVLALLLVTPNSVADLVFFYTNNTTLKISLTYFLFTSFMIYVFVYLGTYRALKFINEEH